MAVTSSLLFLLFLLFDFRGVEAARLEDGGRGTGDSLGREVSGMLGSGTAVCRGAGTGVSGFAFLEDFFAALGVAAAGFEGVAIVVADDENADEGIAGGTIGVCFLLTVGSSVPRSGLEARATFCFLDFVSADLISSAS